LNRSPRRTSAELAEQFCLDTSRLEFFVLRPGATPNKVCLNIRMTNRKNLLLF
jgi:hypothetical protein